MNQCLTVRNVSISVTLQHIAVKIQDILKYSNHTLLLLLFFSQSFLSLLLAKSYHYLIS